MKGTTWHNPPWLIKNLHFCYGGNSPAKYDKEEKQHFRQQEKHKNIKEAYTDGSKNIGRKVGFVVVFTDTTKWGALPEEASIHTAEMTAIKVALKEVHKRKDKRWVKYTDTQRSMQSILAELQAQDKNITL